MEIPFDSAVRPAYRLLSENQIRIIHEGTLKVLGTTGVRVAHEEGLQLLRDAGCRIQGHDTVLLPGDLVEASIRSAPKGITIHDRQGQVAMRLEGRNSYYGLGTDLIRTQDVMTGEIRASVLQDVVNAARVSDACKHIDFIASFALPHDVPTNTMYIACVKAQMENSTKPIFFTAAGREDLSVIIEMAASVAGGEEALRQKPFLIHYSEPTPPLVHSFSAVAKLFLCAEKGIPICYTPAAMLGGSAPVTLAGGLVQSNAEALSGLVLHQLKKEGAPIISGVALPPLDMRTSCVSYSAPELRLANSAFTDMYHFYGIPMWSSAGSDAHTLDAQAALEHALTTLMAALDGANLIHDVAYLGQGLLGNPAAIVMCDEIIAYIKRMMQGFDLGAEAMGLETIHKVGPGGNYLTERHTLVYFRDAIWQPPLLSRENFDSWEQQGCRRYEQRVTERARAILEAHQPAALPEPVQRRLEEILARAEADLAGLSFVA